MKKIEVNIVLDLNGNERTPNQKVLFYDDNRKVLYEDKNRFMSSDIDELINYYKDENHIEQIGFLRYLKDEEELIVDDYPIMVYQNFSHRLPMNQVLNRSFNRDVILCNQIHEIDQSVYDNALFRWDDCNKEILQWYLTSFSESDAEYLSEHSELLITYSNTLDLYVLCMTQMEDWNNLMIDVDSVLY